MSHGCKVCDTPNGCECPRPNWGVGNVPYCAYANCPRYDGKRCQATGFQPHTVCVPVTEKLISNLKTRAKERDPADFIHYMLLWCPECGERHIDTGEFETKSHHTHACQECGHVWRPAIGPTCGVRFLPGFKNEE